MKKRLVVLLIAVVALFLFAGCEEVQPVVLDETASVTLEDVGINNYDLSGKTLVKSEIDYITKKTETIVTNNTTGKSTSTITTENIPLAESVTTLIFSSDGNFTLSFDVTYLSGADGDYRETVVTNATAATTTTIETTYRFYYTVDGTTYVDNYDEVHTGRAGVTVRSDSFTGTWKSVDVQRDSMDDTTLEYYVSWEKRESTTQLLPRTSSEDAPENAYASNTDKYTYTLGNSVTYVSTATEDEFKSFTCTSLWDDEDGDAVEISLTIDGNDFSGVYTAQ